MESIFNTVLNMSITGSYIAAALIILRLLMKKLPKRYSYAMWAILGVRLLCPFSFSSIISVFNFLKPEATGNTMTYVSEEIKFAKTPEISVGLPPVNRAINNVLSDNFSAETPVLNSVNPMQIVYFICTSIWAAGAAALLIYTVVSYLRVWGRLRTASRLRDNIFVSGRIDTPFVFGIFRPRIYLPEGVSENDMKYILAHEQTHIRRGDHIVKLLAMLILCVHWFNPLVWVSYKLMTKDMELSCDERAIKAFGGEARKEYAAALLGISARQNKITLGGVLAFGESGIKTRIKNVLSYKKPALWIIIVGVIAVAAAAVVLMTNASPLKKDEYGLEVDHVDGNYYGERDDWTIYYKDPADWTWDRIYESFTIDGLKLSPDMTVERLGERYKAEFRHGSYYDERTRELCLHLTRDGEQIAYIYLDGCLSEEDSENKTINGIQFSTNSITKENYDVARLGGIGMGSTEKEVIEALGTPYSRSSAIIEYRNDESDHAIIFWIDRTGFVDDGHDKVMMMSVLFRTPPEAADVSDMPAPAVTAPDVIMKAPPELQLVTDAGTVKAYLATYSWDYETEDGSYIGDEVDAAFALDEDALNYYPPLGSAASPTVRIFFPDEGVPLPDEIKLDCYNAADIGNYEARGTDIPVTLSDDGIFFAAPDGEYTYDLAVRWKGEKFDGLAHYGFRSSYGAAGSAALAINADLISELGMTYSELSAKYGEAIAADYGTCVFTDGYGRYTWKRLDGEEVTDVSEAGGCNMIDGVSFAELFGTLDTVSFERLESELGFKLVSADTEQGMDYRYWSEFSHPSLTGVSFIFAANEYGVIDGTTSIALLLSVDSTEARPVISVVPEQTEAAAAVPEPVTVPETPAAGTASLPVLTEPPKLYVYAHDDHSSGITADLGAFSWSYPTGAGAWSGVDSSSVHPLDSGYGDMPTITTPSDSSYTPQSNINIVLSFGAVFSDVNVRYWDINKAGDTAAKPENANWSYQNDSSYVFVSMPVGEYICEVEASWDVPDRYRGNAHYVFRVNCTKVYVQPEVIDDDGPMTTIGPAGYILLDGKEYYPFPDSLNYTVIDGVYYAVWELLIPDMLPERLNEGSLERYDDIAKILAHDSAGTLRYTDSPSGDLDTDIERCDGDRVYKFDGGFDIFGQKYYLFIADETPLYEIGGQPIYRMSLVTYDQFEQ